VQSGLQLCTRHWIAGRWLEMTGLKDDVAMVSLTVVL
jgi:hypothetical protein